MPNSTIFCLWRDKFATQEFSTGVSLHSHTNQSQETLNFMTNFGEQFPGVGALLRRLERRSEQRHDLKIQYASSYWTPPMTPRLAYDLERAQIEKLDLQPMVSISDHDNIKAPLLLRSVPSARQIPISVEWSIPCGPQYFHLGIHNLPSAHATAWMNTFEKFTANPCDKRLGEILAALNDEPNVLIVFNHPVWDLCLIGQGKHDVLLNDFLQKYGMHIHALELNGLRHLDENCCVQRLAAQWNMLLISGGDRHGVEPNANLNLTNASCFTEFVHEVRYEKKSNILFMPQYAEPWKHRMLQAGIDALRYYPEFPEGSKRWDERIFHPDRNGVMRPLCELWPYERAPKILRWPIATMQMMGRGWISNGIRFVLSESRPLSLATNESER